MALLEAVEAALAGGVDAVQLRDKNLSGADLYQLGRELSALTRRHGASFYINDRIDLALSLRAHGVQNVPRAQGFADQPDNFFDQPWHDQVQLCRRVARAALEADVDEIIQPTCVSKRAAREL